MIILTFKYLLYLQNVNMKLFFDFFLDLQTNEKGSTLCLTRLPVEYLLNKKKANRTFFVPSLLNDPGGTLSESLVRLGIYMPLLRQILLLACSEPSELLGCRRILIFLYLCDAKRVFLVLMPKWQTFLVGILWRGHPDYSYGSILAYRCTLLLTFHFFIILRWMSL